RWSMRRWFARRRPSRPSRREAGAPPPIPMRPGGSGERGGRTGYKLHVGVDAGSGIVRRARLTPANVNEITMGPALVAGDEASVWADKAYVGPTMAGAITTAGARNRVQRRRQKNRPLRPSETRRNVLIGRVRG